MKLVVGLGNPGPEYVWSRHNAGWLLLDSYIGKIGMTEPRMKFGGAFWPAVPLEDERVAFLKPFTYMNLSGRSVGEAAKYFDVVPEDILVIFDDASLPFGKIRYRSKGSAGGQKGMISVITTLGTPDIPRLRVGIGSSGPHMDMVDWVLGKFPKNQRDRWPELEDVAWSGLMKWLKGDAGDGFTLQIPEEGK